MESPWDPITAGQCKEERCTSEKGMSFHTVLLSGESVDGIVSEIKTGIKNNHVSLTSTQTTTD